MINKEKAIDNIIENFDWIKVHKAMTALKWTWFNSEGETPSIGALFRCATDLLHGAYDGAQKTKENFSFSTGGFSARAIVDDKTKEIISLRLSFEVSNWDYDYEEDF